MATHTIQNGDAFPDTFVHGDTWSLDCVWNGSDGNPVDITNIDLAAGIKKEYSQDVLVNWTVTKTDAANGAFTLSLTPEQTAELPPRRGKRITTFLTDVQATYTDGTVKTVWYTSINMQAQVTS